MPSIGSSFLILGLVVAFVTAAETRTVNESSTDLNNTMFDDNNITDSLPTSITTSIIMTTTIPTVSSNGGTMKITTISTIPPFHPTNQSGNGSSNDGQGSRNTTSKATTKPQSATMSITKYTTTTMSTTTKQTTEKKKAKGDSTGIIILIVIIIVALVFGIACYFSRKRARRYSVDFTSRQDDANIPLSTVEPVETAPQNGLQTFETAETATKELQEPEAKPEEQAEQKAEAEKSSDDPSAESAALAPSRESTEDKPKEDVAEPSPPPAPVEPSVGEKTDDEGAVSNKTSVESLKETNENNSNNADFSQRRDLKSSSLFWDVPLDSPV
ncbi:uncharacterized protein ABDE67_008074 [Symphorus nematophorus]